MVRKAVALWAADGEQRITTRRHGRRRLSTVHGRRSQRTRCSHCESINANTLLAGPLMQPRLCRGSHSAVARRRRRRWWRWQRIRRIRWWRRQSRQRHRGGAAADAHHRFGVPEPRAGEAQAGGLPGHATWWYWRRASVSVLVVLVLLLLVLPLFAASLSLICCC